MTVSVFFSDEMILPETSYILTPMIYKMGWAIQQGPKTMVDEKTRHDTKTVTFVTKKVPRFVVHICLNMIDDICRAYDI